MVDVLHGATKTYQLFKVSVILPPSGKISAGAHVSKSHQCSSTQATVASQPERRGVTRHGVNIDAAVTDVTAASSSSDDGGGATSPDTRRNK